MESAVCQKAALPSSVVCHRGQRQEPVSVQGWSASRGQAGVLWYNVSGKIAVPCVMRVDGLELHSFFRVWHREMVVPRVVHSED